MWSWSSRHAAPMSLWYKHRNDRCAEKIQVRKLHRFTLKPIYSLINYTSRTKKCRYSIGLTYSEQISPHKKFNKSLKSEANSNRRHSLLKTKVWYMNIKTDKLFSSHRRSNEISTKQTKAKIPTKKKWKVRLIFKPICQLQVKLSALKRSLLIGANQTVATNLKVDSSPVLLLLLNAIILVVLMLLH